MTTRVMWLCQWIANLFWIQLYVIVGTLLGLGIFGFFPALYAGSSLMTAKLRHGAGEGSFHVYMARYRQYFWRANKIGWITLGLLLIVGSNAVFYGAYGGEGATKIVSYIWDIILVEMFLTSQLVFPIIVENHLGLKDIMRMSFFVQTRISCLFTAGCGFALVIAELAVLPGIAITSCLGTIILFTGLATLRLQHQIITKQGQTV